MTEPIFLYIGLAICMFAILQSIFGVAIYFTILSKFTGGKIVAREKEPNEFKTAIIIQLVTGCFLIVLEILV
ncbi:MAG: hypothetical protein KKD63_04495 [Proteobacteria bacterium]|nr:hypothetical protein [Desulfobulbaceae bacterium]MBU4152121.1 hypothetical protein [Pseudomonadota bacterium]